MLRDCNTDGCKEKRHGQRPYCKSCRTLSEKRPITCFLCEVGISRDVSNAKGKKPKMQAFKNASERTTWVASVDARHTRAESAEGKGETMVGAKEIATKNKRASIMGVKLVADTAAKLNAPFFQSIVMSNRSCIIAIRSRVSWICHYFRPNFIVAQISCRIEVVVGRRDYDRLATLPPAGGR